MTPAWRPSSHNTRVRQRTPVSDVINRPPSPPLAIVVRTATGLVRRLSACAAIAVPTDNDYSICSRALSSKSTDYCKQIKHNARKISVKLIDKRKTCRETALKHTVKTEKSILAFHSRHSNIFQSSVSCKACVFRLVFRCQVFSLSC